jgi:hypothetical protein
MMVRHDFYCNDCDIKFEAVVDNNLLNGVSCKNCESHNTVLIFTAFPQTIIDHADVIQKVEESNRKRMKVIYEEDAATDSSFNRQFEENVVEAGNIE